MKKLKVKKIGKRYLLFTLSLLLLITTLGNGGSIFAMLESNDTPKNVSSFEETTIELTVPIETEKDQLELPETLKGKLVGSEETIDIPVTWNDNDTYDKTKAGEYTFTSNSDNYIYEGDMPTAIVTLEEVTSDEKVDSPTKEEVLEVEAPEPAGKVSSIANVVLNKITGELTETPIIDENDPAIGADAKVVVIHGSTNKRQGHATLDSAMQSIGTNTDSYVVVFIEDYIITPSDRSAISNHGKNASLITFTSKYNNGVENIISLLNWGVEWSASTNTTFKDIKTEGNITLFSNDNKLIIDSGVDNLPGSANAIYGILENTTGDAKIEVKSGLWDIIASSKDKAKILSGNIDISVSGTANVGSIYGSKGPGSVEGTSTITIDGSEKANVHGTIQTNNENYAKGGTTVNLKSINMQGSLDLSGKGGGVVLNIEGECTNTGSTISTEVVVGGTINLEQDAILNLDGRIINSPNANITFAANSKIQIKSSIPNNASTPVSHTVNNIKVNGSNAKFLLPADATDNKEQFLLIKGKIEGSEKLAIGFLEGGDAVVGRKFVEFGDKKNTDKTKFDFYRKGAVNPTYKEGVEKYYKYIVYTDYVPDDGYVYESGETVTVGGNSSEDTDIILDFEQWENATPNYKSSDYGKMEMRNLYAKVKGYKPVPPTPENSYEPSKEEKKGYFRNFFSGTESDTDSNFDADHHLSVKVNSQVFLILSSPPFEYENEPIGSYKGYKRLEDGTISFMFYLKDYGVFYVNAKNKKGSSDLDISWTYENKTTSSQKLLVSYGGGAYYACKEYTFGISPEGSDTVVTFIKPEDPAMFMYVNEKSQALLPAAIGPYSGDSLNYRIRDGEEFDNSNRLTDTKTADTMTMGLQWKYDVSANATQKGSGGVRIAKPGDLQLSSGGTTYENPMNDTTASVSIDLLNLSLTKIELSEEKWDIKNPYDGKGIKVTAPESTSIGSLETKKIDFSVEIDGTVPPGDYPIEIILEHDGKEYTTEATITVVRDIQTVDVTTKNTDGTDNTTAISKTKIETTKPLKGSSLYKFYDVKLTWSQQGNSSITDIKVNGQSLSNDVLEKAKKDRAIEFPKIEETKKVELVVKEYNAEVEITKIGSFLTNSFYTENKIALDQYHTYAHSGNGVTSIFEVKNGKATTDIEFASYNISGTTDSITETDPKVYVSSTLALDENKKSIPLSGDIGLPADGESLYIFCDYDTKDVSTEIVTKSTTLVLTGGGSKVERTIEDGMVAGKPELIQKAGTPVSEFYSSGELNNFEDGHLKDTLYFNGIEGRTSNSDDFADYTNKNGSAYFDTILAGYTSANNMSLSYSVKHKDYKSMYVGKEEGIYSLSMILRDAQFVLEEDTGNNSDVLNRYIHMLDPSKFAYLTISQNRNAYIDASDAVVTKSEAKKMINASGTIVKNEFLKKHKVNGATINPNNGEALPASNLTVVVDGLTKNNIQDGIPGDYEFYFKFDNASGKDQATVKVALTIVPDGEYSDDETRMINASPIIVTPSIAETLTENENEKLKSVLNIKSWLSDKDTGTLKEEKATVTLAADVKAKIDEGAPGEYPIQEISSPGNGISQVKIKDFKYLIVAPEDAEISKNNDLYIWAQDKIVDTKDTKEKMENETDIGKVLKTSDFMNVTGKYKDGVDQKDKTKVEVVSGGSFDDIKNGEIGKYVIRFETTHNGITVAITRTLTIIDNDSTWGVNIPKNFMLNKDEDELKESKVELIGEGKYTISDFTETFSVDVSINTKNGLILTENGAEVNGKELESKIGRYKFVIQEDITNPDSKWETKIDVAKGGEITKKNVSQSNPSFKFKTGISQKPAPIGDYKDTLIFEFTPNGIAISKVKE